MGAVPESVLQSDIALLEHTYRTLKQWMNVAIAFLVLSLVFVGLRLLARKLARNAHWGWDDYLILGPALLSNVAVCGSAICEQCGDSSLAEY